MSSVQQQYLNRYRKAAQAREGFWTPTIVNDDGGVNTNTLMMLALIGVGIGYFVIQMQA